MCLAAGPLGVHARDSANSAAALLLSLLIFLIALPFVSFLSFLAMIKLNFIGSMVRALRQALFGMDRTTTSPSATSRRANTA